MNNERLIGNEATCDYISYDVLIDNQETDVRYQIMSIMVTKEVNRIPTARLVIRDGDASDEDFDISNSNDYVPGNSIELKSGRDGENSTIFKGIITKQRLKVREDGSPCLIVECKDEAVKMTVGRKNRYFKEKSDKQIIESLLSEHGVKGTVEATKGAHKESVQYYSTDWDFMLCRAEMNGKLVFVNDGKVDVLTPNTNAAVVETLIFGSTLFEVETEMDARFQWKSVHASSWDSGNQKLLEAKATGADFKENGNINGKKLADVLGLAQYELRHSGNVNQEELQAWADACMLKSRLSKIVGRVKYTGISTIIPGSVVQLKGLGNRFNGPVFITAVRHELVEGTWYSHAQFGLGVDWFYNKPEITAAPASGLMPGIQGLQIGKVKKFHQDPDGEYRVLVRLPIIDESNEGIWTRIVRLDAGPKRGSFWLPEVEDEVVVGFVNGDPRDAYILGSLHSKKNKAPIESDEKNTEKGFVTREELKFIFNDVDKSILLETPGLNQILISNKEKSITIKDEHKNAITLDKNGITLDSSKDIVLKAKNNINLTANMDYTLSAMNVALEAKSNFSAEGKLGAKLASPLVTTIQGTASVNIN